MLTIVVKPIEVKIHSFVRSFVRSFKESVNAVLPCTYQVYTIRYILRFFNSSAILTK